MKTKKCKICGAEFTPYSSMEKYCGLECAKAGRKELHSKTCKKAQLKNISKFSGGTGKMTIKCKECKNTYDRYASQVKYRGSNFCSTKCKNEWKKKQKPTKKTVDDLWANIVKTKAGWKCEYCGKTSYINAHHIFSRTNHSTRWDIENGIALCAGHHTFSSTFSAHKAPIEFSEWVKEYRGQEWYERLRLKAREIAPKVDLVAEKIRLEEIKEELKVLEI